MTAFFPKNLQLHPRKYAYAGQPIHLKLSAGLTVFVGPNGSGKTESLKSTRDIFRGNTDFFTQRKIVYLSAGRNSPLENFRSSAHGPNHTDTTPATVGQQGWEKQWWQIEGSPGMFLRLQSRSDLLLKVEAGLQALYQRRHSS